MEITDVIKLTKKDMFFLESESESGKSNPESFVFYLDVTNIFACCFPKNIGERRDFTSGSSPARPDMVAVLRFVHT